jgi:AbrB family transcriptional regulator, transcriptional pleiotropic regulator of transition state genes
MSDDKREVKKTLDFSGGALSTGVVRAIDYLGRIVLPRELRGMLDIEVKDPLEIFTGDNGEIIFKKYQPGCIFCNDMKNPLYFHNKKICSKCLGDIRNDKICT